MHSAHILIVDDSLSMAMTYQNYLEQEKHSCVIADTAGKARALLEEGIFSLVLLDIFLPDRNGLDFLKSIRHARMDIPVIVMTGEPSIDLGVDAIRQGAQDFLSKPVSPDRLKLTVKNILEQHNLKTMVKTFKRIERDRFHGFVGKSPAMQVVYQMLENAAQSKAPVFITGESGTGKELAAQAVHALSTRRDGAFEALNCAAIPETLLESEIFGHVKGAYTGAVSNYVGAAGRADRGTLFLDEIGEMPMDMQSKLLRFTQSNVFRAVGSGQEQTVDVRLVSATNRDPQKCVYEHRLREDLYYRLNVIPVNLPPLRERGEDILLIAKTFLSEMSKEEGRAFEEIDKSAEDKMMLYTWPGNVRQMQNILRRAVVLNKGTVLTADMLEFSEEENTAPQNTDVMALSAHSKIIPLRDVEKGAIEQAIIRCGGNISEAARQLDVNPSTLHRKLNKWKEDISV